MKMMKMKMMIRMMKLVIYGSAHHNEDSHFAQYCNSHHISAIVFESTWHKYSLSIEFILYSQFNLGGNFFSFFSFFSKPGLFEIQLLFSWSEGFCSVHRGNEFCFKTILCLNPHLNHLRNPSCERILEGAQKKKKPKTIQRLRTHLMSENLCHKLLPGSYQKKFFLSWRRERRCLIF